MDFLSPGGLWSLIGIGIVLLGIAMAVFHLQRRRRRAGTTKEGAFAQGEAVTRKNWNKEEIH